MDMIHVIATIELNEGCREDFLKILNENVPKVRAEEGCLTYEPTVDVEPGLPIPVAVRENVVTIVEAWESLEALHAHLKTPHMASYREAVKDLVSKLSLQVLQPV
jgi:quinol monooxygenase YgiN